MPEHEDGYRELRHAIMGYIVSQAIFAVTEAGVPDLLADGPAEAGDLAERAGADADALVRFLRVLVAEGLFTEGPRGTFALTATGAYLRADRPGSLRHLVTLMAGEPYRAWGLAGHSLRTGEPAFDELFGQPMFAWLRAHPAESAAFDTAQAGLVTVRMQPLVERDWRDARTVVDVGGGTGELLRTLLAGNPHLRGVLFDLPHVAGEADVPAERCAVVGGDFFTGVPAGGDVYVLAQILHDWDDHAALRILREVAAAMPPHGTLLVVEQVIPEDDARHPEKILDLHMLVLLGGRERTAGEWRRLFAAGGFALTEIEHGTRSVLLVGKLRGPGRTMSGQQDNGAGN
ncbi:methyltransferase [Nonomuraea fuscirosea]|uniref:methyltransferase n=1 Tax=Nonomuraea fuscirosea TaxID=1291556 RepID=UPI00343C32FC